MFPPVAAALLIRTASLSEVRFDDRYALPVHMIKLTQGRETAPYVLWIGVEIGATRQITLFQRILWSRQATFHRGPLLKFATRVIHQARRFQPFQPFRW
jgi:hypothetical protein